jgi:isoleucyl-tRNA synthetase
VKEIIFDKTIAGEVELDTTITPELKEEGEFRELVRAVQDLRKKRGLTIQDMATLLVDTNADGKKFIEKFSAELRKFALLRNVEFAAVTHTEKIQIGERVYAIDVKV